MDRGKLLSILTDYKLGYVSLKEASDRVEELFNTVPEAKSLEERKREFIESVRPFVGEIGKGTANEFCSYWLQKSERGRKYKFEKEKTWDIKLRLKTWMRNKEKFSIVNMLKR